MVVHQNNGGLSWEFITLLSFSVSFLKELSYTKNIIVITLKYGLKNSEKMNTNKVF